MNKAPDPADFIQPLNMNGLSGRMLYLPAPKKHNREILVIYGHHALLERWWGLVQNFNDYGAVTMPDIPGFGGMDSFYKIGQKATLDNYADYMAAFIKMRYKRRKVTIVGISFGFLIVTRMLQRYPELTDKVEFLISALGFMHHDDFTFTRRRYLFYRYTPLLFLTPVTAGLFRYVGLNALVLRTAYRHTHNAKQKFAEYARNDELSERLMDMEIQLWQQNDVRTYMKTTIEMLSVDNCQKKINLPVWHVHTKKDHFFNNRIIEQHMRVVYGDFQGANIDIKTHAPSILADKKASAVMVPKELRRLLSKTDKAK
ncbi:MAG: alpha/beta hydrolase [Candidatus Saccharimonadales bacterium]